MMWIDDTQIHCRIDPAYYQLEYVELDGKLEKMVRTSPLRDLCLQMCNGPHGGVTYVHEGNDGVRYIRAKNLERLSINDHDPVYISQADHRTHKRGELKRGDLVITITGANLGDVGVVPPELEGANLIQSLAKIRLKEDLNPYYVAAYLNSDVGEALFRRESVNTAREGINFDYLGNVQVVVPSEEIQNAIGLKVRSANTLTRQVDERLKCAQGHIADLFGELPEVTRSCGDVTRWNWPASDELGDRVDAEFYRQIYLENEALLSSKSDCKRLEDLREANRPITNGIRGPVLAESDYRMLRLQDVDRIWLSSDQSLRVSESQYAENIRAHCNPGDILVAIGGYIGVAGKVVDSNPQTMGQHSARLALRSELVDSDYILAFLVSPYGRTLFERYVSGGVQAGINLEDVREIKVPIPTREVQEEIACHVRKAELLNRRAEQLIHSARRDVWELISSNLDEKALREDSLALEDELRSLIDN